MWAFEWIGEQLLPVVKDASLVYQYLHRYMYASRLLKGKRILDIAAGDGSGSSVLADAAGSVVAVVADERIADHATQRYRKPNLQFASGTIGDISPATEHTFDAVVFFDASESAVESGAWLHDVKRFLKQDGLFIVSSISHDETGAEKLRQLLAAHFKDVHIFGQGVYAVSTIWPIPRAGDVAIREMVTARDDADQFHPLQTGRVPSYILAVASDSPAAIPEEGSVFL